MSAEYHIPVLCREAIELLQVSTVGTYVDATLGGGGYAEAILERLKDGKLYAFDTDPAAHAEAGARLRKFGNRLVQVRENFGKLEEALWERGVREIDGIVFDLGVSSHQLDTDAIGLSYRIEAPLDMRLDPRLELTAFEIVNAFDEQAIARILRQFGEEPRAARFASRIVRRRTEAPIRTTLALAEIIREGIREDKQSATLSRVYQAFRIAVNGELEQLERALKQAVGLLKPGGRIVVVSYHSLEDRIVKNAFQAASAPKAEPSSVAYMMDSVDRSRATLKLIGKQPVIPNAGEVERNRRARSAKLRVAEKI